MRRRDVITLIGGATLALPRVARAQTMRRIGVLMSYAENDTEGQARYVAFRDGLRKLGWVADRNIRIDTRWASLDAQSMQSSAKQLVAMQPEVILSANTPTTAALLQQTRTIPIVIANISDPIGSGFVTSLARPAGNVTGFLNIEGSLGGKWVELLKEIAPRVARIAFLHNPQAAPFAAYYFDPFKASASRFGMEAITTPVHDAPGLESVVTAQAREPNGGLIVMPDAFMTAHRAQIISLAAQHRLPTVYPYRFQAQIGGLLSYGFDPHHNFGRAASYVDRILKGDKSGELPFQAQDKFELAINLKTAKALGLDVPILLQQRADEVIE